MVAQSLSLRLGGYAKTLPVLSIADNEEWQTKFSQALADKLRHVEKIKDWDGAVAVASASTSLMLDLLVEYDKSGSLGGREWLRNNATPTEIYDAFKEVAQTSYPFAKDVSRFPALVQVLLTQVAQVSERSTSSPSMNGDGRRKRSGAA